MRFSISAIAALVSIFMLDVVSAASIYIDETPHNISSSDPSNLEKRVDNARFTFYDVGLGACGKTNVASDFVVALNAGQFGSGYPGPHCFQTITISYKGKSARAQIVDKCPGCPVNGLDFSRGLFRYFAPESQGVIYGSWHYGA